MPAHHGSEARISSSALLAARPASHRDGIRAGGIGIVADGATGCIVRMAEPMGSHTLLTGTVANRQLRAVAPSDPRPAPPSVLQLRPRPERITWMHPEAAALEAP